MSKAQSFNWQLYVGGGGRYIVPCWAMGRLWSPALPFVFYASANSRGFLLDQSSAAVYTGQ